MKQLRTPRQWQTVKEPRTPRQWQEAVDLASFLIGLDTFRKNRLLRGGPEGDLDRCRRILARGAKRGIRPLLNSWERLAREFFSPPTEPSPEGK